ncbi:response regulator [Myxococcota bacterium]|nr:response regulator [Myxococcota bacterium]
MGSSSDLPSRDRLRALGADVLVDALEHLPDACTLSRAVRDARGSAIDLKLLWMNAHARAAQPDPEAAIGGLCSRLWPAMIENGSFGACLRVLDTGVPEAGLFDWTDGETFLEGGYEYRATRVGDDLLLWVLRDSSARVRQLLETMKQREELERQLRHAQKMEVVGRLAAGVAHDFNNLLTVVTGTCSELELDIPAGSAFRARVDDISAAAARAAALTRQLLAFSRQQVVVPRTLDLSQTVHDVHRLLRRLIGEDVELVMELDDALWTAHADPGLVEQVLVNLAVNARDAMPRGGRLVIHTANTRGPDPRSPGLTARDWVTLTIRDTGHGMDEHVKAHLFEPFFTTKPPGRGTGLGLATVKGIIDELGGTIRVDSTLGEGTTFTIGLPRGGVITAAPAASDAKPRDVRGLSVLVAEDDDAVRALTTRVLKRRGYDVLTAASGEEALELATRHRAHLDLLLTDVVMTKMTGRELADAVRQLHPEIRVLFVSGYTDDALIRAGVLPAGNAFLPKPYSAATLTHRIEALLDAG